MEREQVDTILVGRAARAASFRLVTLGRLALMDADGREERSLATRPRKLAVLAWLALRPGRRATRDRLIGVFWGGRGEDRARNSLSDALSHLRRTLGRETIVTEADEVRVAADAPLRTDASELVTASAAGDHERVTTLYAGPFLDGMYVDDAPEFDDWRDRERARLVALFAKSALARCTEMARARRWEDCQALAERWLDAEPASADAALFLLNAIKSPGTPASRVAAVAAYEALAKRLDRELGVSPHASVTALVRDVATQLADESPAPPALPAPRASFAESRQTSKDAEIVTPAPSTVPAHASVGAPPRRRLVAAYLAGAVTIGAATVLASMRAPEPALSARRVVVTTFENRTGDTTLAPLGRIAADWISRGLTETHAVEVVEPLTVARGDSAGVARAAGRQTGAAMVVVGAVIRAGDSVGVEARVVDARTGRVLRAVEPALSSRADPLAAVSALRQRVVGALAAETDTRIAALAREASQPPTYDAYLAFVQGLDLFSHRDYLGAVPYFVRAASLDSQFVSPRIWEAAAYGNSNDLARADSVLRAIDATRAPRGPLAPLDRGLHDYWRAILDGDRAAQYTAATRALADAPGSELAAFMAGRAAIAVGRYDEAVDMLRRIHVERSGVSWDTYGTHLAEALHLAGRYDDEIIETRRRLSRQPTLLQAIEEHARALAAAGRLADVDGVMSTISALPPQPGRSPGRVMLATALELEAHGHPDAARSVARRAADWVRARPAAEQREPGRRQLLGRALYSAGEWAAADSVFVGMLATQPASADYLGWAGLTAARLGNRDEARRISDALAHSEEPYLLGDNTLARARIAAIFGARDEAVRLLRQALAEGVGAEDLHTLGELRSLRGDPAYDTLVRPER